MASVAGTEIAIGVWALAKIVRGIAGLPAASRRSVGQRHCQRQGPFCVSAGFWPAVDSKSLPDATASPRIFLPLVALWPASVLARLVLPRRIHASEH
jgi:hypothetical protein